MAEIGRTERRKCRATAATLDAALFEHAELRRYGADRGCEAAGFASRLQFPPRRQETQAKMCNSRSSGTAPCAGRMGKQPKSVSARGAVGRAGLGDRRPGAALDGPSDAVARAGSCGNLVSAGRAALPIRAQCHSRLELDGPPGDTQSPSRRSARTAQRRAGDAGDLGFLMPEPAGGIEDAGRSRPRV